MGKSRVLIVGGSGYLGRRLVKASLALGHPTYILQRREIGLDIEKIQILLNFKQQGARLVEASFSDHRSLVEAVKLVDVVVCALSGVHHRSHSILMQLKLVDAAKEAGNIKRFVPSEFGMDPARMAHALSPGRNTFDEKMVVRKAIEDAGIPHTYVSANCFAGYMVGGLCQFGSLMPTRDRVHLHGDGSVKAVFVDEDDVGTYTIKAVDDPRTLNKTLYIRPPENVLSQMELVKKWEKLIGKQLEKISISEEEFLASKKGCLTNFEIGEDGAEASKLYPEVKHQEMGKSRILIVGGSGHIGRRLVKASWALGHPTYILQRREIGLDIEKIEILLDFKHLGPRLVEASFFDHRSLVEAVKLVDVVVCAVSGVHHRGHSILMQLSLLMPSKKPATLRYIQMKTIASL
ncbi:Isoflavone reductase-like protein [Nymphaea thermarum]|nr:Isoflavone reductase-like protein [Nymphaea thermarum]